MIKRMKVLTSTPQAWVSILKPIEWQGITDDDGLSPFTSGAGRLEWSALPMCKLKKQRCQTLRDDYAGLLKAVTLFNLQSETAVYEDLFALLVLEGGAGITPNGPGLLTMRE